MTGKQLLKQLTNEHILIVGFGYRTGLLTSNFLMQKDITVSISDNKNESELSNLFQKLIKQPENFYTGNQTEEQLKGIDRIILSPGVPFAIPLIQSAVKRGIPVWSEIELAYRFLPDGVKIIGVTGTDGKSTTVSLIHHILKTKFNSFLGGNIGTPFISFVENITPGDVVVLELSSYQLEYNETFNCDIACILNIAEDHLDRYSSFDEYINAKENILKSQRKQDIAILNADDSSFKRHLNCVKGKLVSFSKFSSKKTDAYIDNNSIFYNNKKICSTDILKIKGVHNLENTLCSVAVACELSVDFEKIHTALSTFEGLHHRNEFIRTFNGIDFINDSKATTINAVKKALESQEKPVILMLGGRDKGLDFSQLDSLIEKKTKNIILFGEARDKIASQIKNGKKYDRIADFTMAVTEAYKKANKGDVVLLSPGCTSWDVFSSYEERGDFFRKIVLEFK